MDLEQYYTVNKVFLKILGIWFHDKSRLVLLQQTLIIFLNVTCIIMQLSVFITTKCDVALFFKIMSFVCPGIILTLTYCVFILKSKTIQIMHHQMQEDWKILRDKVENEILQKHARIGQKFIIFVYSCAAFCMSVIIFSGFLPVILDIILPLDEPRTTRKLIIPMEYFVSQDKYLYSIILHEAIIIILYVLILLATGIQQLMFLYHSFGMFKITGYRIEYFIEDCVLHTPNPEKEHEICKRIMHAVIAHRRAMEFSNMFETSFNIPYCIIAVLGVLSLSINLFRLVEAMTISKSIDDGAMSFFASFLHIIYMFLAGFYGQTLTDYNRKLFKLIYGTSWYLMPVPSQKLILFLMQRSGKDFFLTIGFLLTINIEVCGTVLNTALSYVAVMYSIR